MNKAIITIIAIIVMFVATGCGSTLTQNRIKDSQTSITHAAPYSGPEPPPPICDKQREKAMEYLTWFTPPSESIQESDYLQPELDEVFKEIGKALGSCQNLSPFNEAANLLNGQAHTYRYLYHGRSHSDLVVARLSFEQALRNNPEGNKEVRFWLSFIQHELGWKEKSQRNLKKAGFANLSWDSVEKMIRGNMPALDEEFPLWVDSELKRIAPLSKERMKPASVSKKKAEGLTSIKKSVPPSKKQSPPKKKLVKKTVKPQKKKPYNHKHISDKAPSVNDLEKNYQKWLNSKR